eukprot:m.303555 g.303555  ORF g.303555 m.303555 type:complete len:404 (+) comp19591_c0_seq23:3706-4917(+)
MCTGMHTTTRTQPPHTRTHFKLSPPTNRSCSHADIVVLPPDLLFFLLVCFSPFLILLRPLPSSSSSFWCPLQVRNDSWTFESVRANHPVPPRAVSFFEVQIKTAGIIQIGWANRKCRFGPQRGLGVGDDENSVAFDGSRQRMWHGGDGTGATIVSSYGNKWQAGDVIGCLFDGARGAASFFHNGTCMGEACAGLDPNETWYPAVSLTTSQQVRCNFGRDGFAHDVLGAHPIQPTQQCLAQRRESVLVTQRRLSTESDPSSILLYFELAARDLLGCSFGVKNFGHEDFCCTVDNDGLVTVCGSPTGVYAAGSRSVVGCGVMGRGQGSQVFFTVDGQLLSDFVALAPEPSHELLPCINAPRVSANFGQGRFVFQKANAPAVRGHLARVWVERCALSLKHSTAPPL